MFSCKKCMAILLAFLCILSAVPVLGAEAPAVSASVSAQSSSVAADLETTLNKSITIYFGVDTLEKDGHPLNAYEVTVWYDPEYLSLAADPLENIADVNGTFLTKGAASQTKTIGDREYAGYTYSFASYEQGFGEGDRGFTPLFSLKFVARRKGESHIYITRNDTKLLPLHSDNAPEFFTTDLYNDCITITTAAASQPSGGGGGNSSGSTSTPPSNMVTVTFMVDKTATAMQVLKNGYITPPIPNPKEGLEFKGWYTNETYTTLFDFSQPVTSNLTLYALYGKAGTTEPVPPADNNPFTDIAPADWYYESVIKAYDMALVGGTSATTFSPDMTLTRGTMVTLLYRMEKEPAAPQNPFTDVASGIWYENAVAWAAEQQIVLGIGNNLFAPDAPITREQIALILYKYAKLKGDTTTVTRDLSGFTDGGNVSVWAKEGMCWALEKGLIRGTSETTLSPQNQATRAEIVTILIRYLGV